LFAHGETFQPDTYLASAPFTFDGVWHKGESGRNHPKSSGVFKVLGDGRTLPLHEQERIAIDFLAANQAALKELAQFPGVTTFILGLQYHIDLKINLIGFCVTPPTRLMKYALEIGIEPTYYVTLEMRREWAPGSA
jgi:hypothetical protein